MRLSLPEPFRDPAVFQPIFDDGMRKFPRRRENFELSKSSVREKIACAMPILADIEPTNRCNYRCTMCVVGNQPQQCGRDMTLDEFRAVLDVQYGLWEVKLQGLGEPLLNRDFHDMAALCTERSIWTRTTTNGSLLHMNDNAKRLLESGIGEVQVSLDGATREVYEGIRRGGNFSQFADNCRLLNKLAQPLRATPAPRAFVLVQRANVHQLEDILSFCADVGFQRVIFSLNLGWFGREDLKENNRILDARDTVTQERCQDLLRLGKKLGMDVAFWQDDNKFKTGRPETLCTWLWERVFISADCRIVPCCTISDPAIMDMGDAGSFAEYWNEAAYRKLRHAHLSGRLPSVCRSCYEVVKVVEEVDRDAGNV